MEALLDASLQAEELAESILNSSRFSTELELELKRWIQKMESLPAVASDFKEVAIVNRLRVINVHLRAVLELGGLQHGAKLHKLAEQIKFDVSDILKDLDG